MITSEYSHEPKYKEKLYESILINSHWLTEMFSQGSLLSYLCWFCWLCLFCVLFASAPCMNGLDWCVWLLSGITFSWTLPRVWISSKKKKVIFIFLKKSFIEKCVCLTLYNRCRGRKAASSVCQRLFKILLCTCLNQTRQLGAEPNTPRRSGVLMLI